MPSPNTKPVEIRHTKKEWAIFNKRIKELSKRNEFNNYLYHKIGSLIKDYKNCPDCVLAALEDSTKIKRHHVPLENYNVLIEISKKSKIPIAKIIDRILIRPLLIEK